jgi:DnaA family protein
VSSGFNQSRQLVLPLQLQEQRLFSNFVPGANRLLIDQLEHFARQPTEALIYLWGGPAAGKTHLLSASCHAANVAGVRSVYIDLAAHSGGSLAVLDGIEHCELVVLDNLDAIGNRAQQGLSAATQRLWQQALYELMYAVRAAGGRMLVAAEVSPLGLDIALPDLRTRLGWGPSWHVQALTDADRRAFLRQKALQKGMTLEADVIDWIMKHHGRDTAALSLSVERLASESLQQRRKPSLSLARTTLSAPSAPSETSLSL